ncbi:MAG: peptidoglycan-associated lipoprotein Pal [bacterium]
MAKKKTLALLLPLLLLGMAALSSGCGRAWSVKGDSFPQESQTGPAASVPGQEKGEQVSPAPASPEREKEADEISRRAEELRKEAERLAQEAGSQGGREKGQMEGGSSASAAEKWGFSPEPERAAETSGGLQSIPDLHDVFFAFNEFLLSEEAQGILQKDAEWLRSHPSARILIEGHCDERGTVEYNLALGERRAQTAKDYLVNLGVSSDRSSIISYGKEKPFALGHDEEAWAQNRRAHFLLRSP